MELIRIEDSADPRIADYLHLTDMDARLRFESGAGVFMAEGELVITRALRAGHDLKSCLVSERKLHTIPEELEVLEQPVFVAPQELLATITGYHVHRGALAAFHRPLPRSVTEVCATASRVMVLEDLVDHTNVGAIFRSAAALGIEAVVLSPRCADPLYRRSLKVSMGATAVLPWTRAVRWPEALTELTDLGLQTVALTPNGDDELAMLSFEGPTAIVVGTEGTGMTPAAMSRCSVRARIAMANGIDSLNVAAAATVACYAMRVQGL